MKKYLILLFIPFLIGAAPSRPNTYSAGNTILSSEVNQDFNTIYNYLTSGVDSFADGTIVNADISSSANVQSDKLNLTSIAQGVNITSSGSFTNAGTMTQSGTSTFSGNTTFSGVTIADLGTVTTGAFTDINVDGGVIDNVTLGQANGVSIVGGSIRDVNVNSLTATGQLLINNGEDFIDGLSEQGTSGQFLKSQGAGASPTWDSPFGNLSTATSVTTGNSGDITIAASKLYKVIIVMTNISADDTIGLRFNSDTAGYENFRHGLHTPGTNTAVDEGNSGYSRIDLGGMDTAAAADKFFTAEFTINTFAVGNMRANVIGQALSTKTDGNMEFTQIGGKYEDAAAVTSFELYTIGAANMTGTVYTYELGLTP